jgi:multiple sugar transport system substrate-binding protein
MIRRRRLLQATAGLLAAPAIVERANAQSAFDWKQYKGTKLEVNFAKSPRADVLQSRARDFEELTGIRVGFEQIPEQQQRPKVAMEMSTGRPSFDVVNVALHVQKRLIEKGRWLEDLRPLLTDAGRTAPDYDFADFGGPGVRAATAADGTLHTVPINQDLFILFYNKALLAEKNLPVPKTYDDLMQTATALTDRSRQQFGFVGRGLKNANVVLFDTFLLGEDQETISADGRTLLMDTPAAIRTAEYYGKLLRDTAPPGVVGFNWNESQTTFSQGRAAMWIDGIGFSAPLVDRSKSKVAEVAGFAPVPRGARAHNTSTFIDGIGVPAGSRNKGGAWLYVQWATSRTMCLEMLRTGSGTPARQSVYSDEAIVQSSRFPPEWFATTRESLKLARSGLPEILAVTEFRDNFGVALTNIITGADPKAELQRATEAFRPILAKELA